MREQWVAFGLALGLVVSACGTTRNGGDRASERRTDRALVERIAACVEARIDEVLELSPEIGRTLGLHEYDGRVRAISESAAEEELERARRFLAETAGIDLERLEDPTKLDVELARLHAERVVFNLEELKANRRIMSYGSLFDVSSYLVRDYAPLDVRVRSMLDHLEAATAEVEPLLALLEKRQPRTHLETARKIFEGMREYYEGDVRSQSAPALERDTALRARFETVVPASLAAVDRVMDWIDRVGLPNANDDFALGERKFLRMLEVNEGIQSTISELDALAIKDFERNHAAFVETARTIDPRLSTQAVVEKVAAERLSADKVLETAKGQLDSLLAFIEARDIVTIGARDRATVAVTPPFMRWNSAFLDQSGPFEKAEGSFYYISPPDPTWPASMQEAYLPYEGDLLATSVHEVYPGHFVQGLRARSAPTRAQKIFDSYAFVEGWAHYAEQMMLDAGFGKGDSKTKLGQLSNALLRNCRFIAAIGLHTRGMSVPEADRLFREKCFIDPGNALQQAYRGTFDPGYLSYTLGKLQILSLREEFFAKRQTRSLRDFHDWLLSFGNAPLALISKRL